MWSIFSNDQMPPAAWFYLQVWLGYVVITAIPGPNMMLVGAIAACRGFRSVMPVILGVSIGAGALVALVYCAVSFSSAQDRMRDGLAAGSAVLLFVIAYRLSRLKHSGDDPKETQVHSGLADALTGFVGGLLNPLACAYFGSHFLAPARAVVPDFTPLVLSTGVFVIALAKLVLVAYILSRQRAQTWFSRHRPKISLVAAAVVAMMAGASCWPIIQRSFIGT